jgi:XTP/dITP diphosphohydrolase
VPAKYLIASSNQGKLREYESLAAGRLVLGLLPEFDKLLLFDESAPTFAENAAGKALHYSRFAQLPVLADDSGLVVPALGGAPGPKSARYGGPNATDGERVQKLLAELRDKKISDRRARFVCVLALAQGGRALAVVSACVEGVLLDAPRGLGGFGYDPIFLFEPLGKTFAEIPREEKNKISHRGMAFRRLVDFLSS